MPKFYGVIGYATTKTTERGMYEETIVEKEYIGDVIRNTRRLRESSKINDDITISNQISIISDPYANAGVRDIKNEKLVSRVIGTEHIESYSFDDVF